MARFSSYPLELRQRAVRMVTESQADYGSEFEAIQAVATKLGIGSAETLRKWVRRAQIDAGQRPGTTTEESEKVKALKKENAELRRATGEILKSGDCRTNLPVRRSNHPVGRSAAAAMLMPLAASTRASRGVRANVFANSR